MDNFHLTGASNSVLSKTTQFIPFVLALAFSISVNDTTTPTNNRVRDLKIILISSYSFSPLPSTVTFKKFSNPLICLINLKF